MTSYNLPTRWSMTRTITMTTLGKLARWIVHHNGWSLLTNCSWFAIGAWNEAGPPRLRTDWLETPDGLVSSIVSSGRSYDVNASLGATYNPSYVGYLNSRGRFVYTGW